MDQPPSLLRRVLPWIGIVVCVCAFYDGWVFYSRWKSNRDAEQASKQQELERDRRTLELLGGGGLKILDFYASPGAIRLGQHADICFGVTGAARVRIEPPVEQLHPAVSYCMQVAPKRDTDYKLFASNSAGHTISQSLSIKVIR